MVHDVDDPERVTRPWPADAEPVRFPALQGEAPRLISGEPVTQCTGPGLGDLPQRLRAAVVRADLDGAESLYGEALAKAPCDADLTAETLGQVGFLGGLVASTRGDRPEAVVRYTRAKSWAPGLDWSDAWPANLRVQFDQAPAPEASSRLTVRPAVAVLVDGRAVDGSTTLAPGPHVVRVGGFGGWIEMPPVDDALVVPAAFPVDALGWMAPDAKAQQRADLAALFGATLGEGRRALVTDGTVTWGGTTGRTDWSETGRVTGVLPVPVPVPDADPVRPTSVRTPRPAGRILLGVGIGAMAVGAGLSTQSWLAAEKNRTSGGTWSEDEHRMGRNRYLAGWITTGAGAVLGGTGLVVTLAGAR